MNIINVEIDFTNGKNKLTGINLITGDYASTKMVFQFDKTAGTKVLEMKNPLGELVYVGEILNNEVVLAAVENGHNYSIFSSEGRYIYEVSLYDGDSKLTSVRGELPVAKEQVIIDGEIVEPYLPIFDELIQDINNKIEEVDEKINDVDSKIETIDDKIEEVNTAIEETNNLDINVSNKVNKEVTITLTKKDNTTKSVKISDGLSLQFMWQGTSLGIKTDDMQDYVFVDLQGIQGVPGPQGEPFRIKKTYPSVQAMNDDFNNMNYGDYVMIASSVEVQDNAKLYTRGELEWIFITDFSGATGIKGETGTTPSISIGSVTSGSTPSVTRTGTDENPILNFVLEKGEKGDTGETGDTGATGNGISNIEKTAETPSQKDYRINYTNGGYFDYSVENGEVTQEQLDEVIEENNYLNSIIDQIVPKVSASGTSVTLDDTIQAKMDIGLNPNTSQETTSGKNRITFTNQDFTLNSVRYYVQNGSLIFNGASSGETSSQNASFKNNFNFTLEAGTYIISHKTGVNAVYLYDYDNDISIVTLGTDTASTTFTLSNTTNVYIGFYVYQKTFNDVNTELMISTNGGDYEPFTFGASPNPNYEQPIHSVSGSNTLKVIGQNIWDEEWELGTYNWSNGQPATSTTSIRSKNKMLIKPNTEYYVKITSEIVIEFFDENNVFLGSSTNVNKLTSGTFTTPANAKYFQLYLTNAYGTTYKNDICINVSNANVNGTYKSYSLQTQDVDLGTIDLMKNATLYDGYINSSNEIVTSSGWKHTDYIDISNTEYLYTYKSFAVASNPKTIVYNADKSVKDIINLTIGGVTTVSGAYIRISYTTNDTIPQLLKTHKVLGNLEYNTIGNYKDEFVRSSGLNEFNTTWIQGQISSNDGQWYSNSSVVCTQDYIPVTPNQHYAINRTINSDVINVRCYDSNKNYLGTGSDYITLVSGTSTSNPMGASVSQCVISPKDNVYYLKFNDLSNNLSTLYMMTKGDTQELYEPYGIGKWGIRKYIKKKIFDGSDAWTLTSSYYFLSPTVSDLTEETLYCNMATYIPLASLSQNTDNRISPRVTSSQHKLWARFSQFNNDVSAFNTYLETHNLIVDYVSSSPTYTPITGTLATQLENVYKKMMSQKGQTNISQVNNDLPFVLSVTAFKELS